MAQSDRILWQEGRLSQSRHGQSRGAYTKSQACCSSVVPSLMVHSQVGHSDTPWGLYSTSEMAKDLIDLLEFLGWSADQSLNVVGVSMGGMIAQELVSIVQCSLHYKS